MYETLEVLKHLPADIVREEFLIPQVQKKSKNQLNKIPQVLRLDVTEEDMEREHRSTTRDTFFLLKTFAFIFTHKEKLFFAGNN